MTDLRVVTSPTPSPFCSIPVPACSGQAGELGPALGPGRLQGCSRAHALLWGFAQLQDTLKKDRAGLMVGLRLLRSKQLKCVCQRRTAGPGSPQRRLRCARHQPGLLLGGAGLRWLPGSARGAHGARAGLSSSRQPGSCRIPNRTAPSVGIRSKRPARPLAAGAGAVFGRGRRWLRGLRPPADSSYDSNHRVLLSAAVERVFLLSS